MTKRSVDDAPSAADIDPPAAPWWRAFVWLGLGVALALAALGVALGVW